ncbi:MAG: hypothetical protein JWQ27_2534 [Ferruginibacter sp.]|nr:hypothetical protein [Ferruginibacter sp.]
MEPYRIEKIGKENFQLLLPLMKDCFGMDVDTAYFEWKYTANPAGSFIGFIAIDNSTNEVGASYNVIPQRLLIDGKESVVYQSCDTMTHSAHRRRGLFKMLALECYRQLREENKLFVIGYGGADSTPGFIKFGWRHVTDFRYSFKLRLFCRLSLPGKSAAQHFFIGFNEKKLREVIDTIPGTNAIHSQRTAAHIAWRIANPRFNYEMVLFDDQNGHIGYIIYYVTNNKLLIFDFIFNGNKSRQALIGYVSREVVKKKYQGLIAICQENGWQEKALAKNNFMRNPFKKGPLSERTPFIFYAEDGPMEKYNNSCQWEMTAYDHDAL